MSRLAPEFKLFINDAPAPAALRASVSSLNWQTGLEGADRVELTLVNENLRWLDSPLLALDTHLKLLIGYAPHTLEQAFVGKIVSQAATFPGGGSPMLTIAAQDRREDLRNSRKVRWFAIPTPIGNFSLPDIAVAAAVSGENGLIPILDPVGAALSIILGGVDAIAVIADPNSAQSVIRKQENENDYDFLQRISRDNGWEMFIEHTGVMGGFKLRFQSSLDNLTPELSLKYGQSLIDFTPRISNVGQIYGVTTNIWVSALKTTLSITVSWDWDRMALMIDVRPQVGILGSQSGRSEYVIDEPLTPLTAPRRIIRELIPRLNQRLTGSGSCIGDPRIRAGTVIRIEGVGAQFGGLYRVTSATHTLDSGGYKTSFEMRKEIWFGSIPMPEQGAVPVKVKTPLGSF